MSAVSYITYAADGRIVSNGECAALAVGLQIVPEQGGVLIGEFPMWKRQYVSGGVVVNMPEPPTPHHIFDYTTKQWIDPRTLADFKAAQWATIKQARESAEFGGFVWDGSEFDSDAISQQRIQGLVHIANLDPNMSVDWTLADNTVRTLTSADGIAVGIALAAHVNTQHVKARALREQIDAATTPEAVQAITWES